MQVYNSKKKSVEIFSHWNRGNSHSHLRSFPLILIPILKFESYSHSHLNPIPMVISRPHKLDQYRLICSEQQQLQSYQIIIKCT